MTKSTNLNRRDVATSASRKTIAYDILKAMYQREHGLDHMPKDGRKWDYSHFDEWLAQKKKELDC